MSCTTGPDIKIIIHHRSTLQFVLLKRVRHAGDEVHERQKSAPGEEMGLFWGITRRISPSEYSSRLAEQEKPCVRTKQ